VPLLRSLCLAISLPFGVVSCLAQTIVATANYGNARTNANPNETVLTRAAVGSAAFGKLGAFPLDGQVYAQPLYVGGLQIPNHGTKNVVFAATMNDSVYAIDADDAGATAPLWQVSLGTAAPSAFIPYLPDIDPTVGILSTPVIDVSGQIIYVTAETFEGGAPVFRLHGLSLLDGHEMVNGPVMIAASVAGTGLDSVNGTITFDPFWHLQRPGLALANGNVYVCFGSHGDAGVFHGWMMAYSAANLQQQTAVFNTTPNGSGGGIWQSGHAPMIDGSGNVYVVSGNGDFDGVSNFSGAVIKLSGSDLSVLDWYVPARWKYLNANDLDVGSTGAVLAAGGALVVAGDKGGRLINLARSQLGHIETGPGVDDFAVSSFGIFDIALWKSDQGERLYQHDWHGYLKAYPVTNAGISRTPVVQGTWLGDSLYQGLAVSSNGTADGIVWETTGDHTQAGVPGVLHAWNASDLTEIWNSDIQAGDVLGAFAKFVSPLVANGRVYVPTFSNQLAIYGLRTSIGSDSTPPQVAAVLNGASFIQDAVSPGEVLKIFGANLGPDTFLTAEVDENGSFPSTLGATQVLFDGVAAPILYTSANQVGLVVPFAVTGTTQMVVQSAAGQSAAASLPVVAARPAIFTSSQMGDGQAAALNQDGTVNSATNPASIGSVITLYANGLGQTNPPSVDGAVAAGVLPVPVLPVTVLFGGLPGYVLYKGAAPGMIDGVFQINVRIPVLAPTGPKVFVVLEAGDFVSQTNVWVALQ
jgi:uncharacterized protein (TIGR03437 family)